MDSRYLVGGLGPHVGPWIVVIPGVDPGPDVGVELQGDATNSTPVSTPTISTATAHLRDVLADQTTNRSPARAKR